MDAKSWLEPQVIAIREHIITMATENGFHFIRCGDNDLRLMKPISTVTQYGQPWVELGSVSVYGSKVRVISWPKIDIKSDDGVVAFELADPSCFDKIDDCLKSVARMAGIVA